MAILSIGLLTYNRMALFEQTLKSLPRDERMTLDIVDNGSTDGTEALVHCLGGICNITENHTTGRGMNLAINAALTHNPRYVLFTADDYEFYPGWLDKLLAFWDAAPAEVGLVSLNAEPVYGWNTIRARVEYGGVRGLVRDTLPGSQWSFRAGDWPLIGPIREATGGEDLEVCQRLRQMGRSLVALDLSTHTGEKMSCWGNQSWQMARALDSDTLEWMGGK